MYAGNDELAWSLCDFIYRPGSENENVDKDRGEAFVLRKRGLRKRLD